MQCLSCRGDLAGIRPEAVMCGGIMGDEYSEGYYRCPRCGQYTVNICRDRFDGEETCFASGPLSPQEAAAKIALIGRCDRPWDKTCRCPAHLEYFDGALD